MKPEFLIAKYKSWKDLNKQLETLTKSKRSKEAGDIFEHLVKLYLQTAPQYQSKLKKVYLLNEVPESLKRKLRLPSTDEGIDLIVETYDKTYWSIQAKYRSDSKQTLTRGDLSTFSDLSFNYCNNIEHGLVCTTVDKPPRKVKLMDNIGFDTIECFYRLDDNNGEEWKAILAKCKGKVIKPKPFKPRPHQKKALKETSSFLKNNDRGKILMPCGTGKSITAYWIAQNLKAKSILVAVPSLALLQQTLRVWTREYLIHGIRPEWLCVCSDDTVKEDQDDYVTNSADIGVKVTTDQTEINSFLKKRSNNIKIVFTTYQSGRVTATGAKGFTFDLGIMDEAHKTVGHRDKPMAHLIHDKNIKVKKRVFMTATERLFRGDKDEYVSMDDIRDYGDIIYQLSFKAAIDMKPPIISDYKIITFNVNEPDIEALYQDNKFIQVQKKINNITAREFATAIALRKAIKKLKIKNAVSFHSSIKRANNFSGQQDLISEIYKEYGRLKTFHVSGEMPTNERASQMREFAEGSGLMTNARCLTEGVDLPAIDCVVFTDPKRSRVDIVQAAGRALRLSKGKKFGYILLPIIVPENESASKAAEDTAFEEIVVTLKALASQDSRIVDYLNAVSSGSKPRGRSPVDGLLKINNLSQINEENFKEAITLKIWDRLSFGWHKGYEQIKKYIVREGTTNNIRQRYVDDDGFNLGSWVSSRRLEHSNKILSSERIKELEALPGWVWNKNNATYQFGLKQLKKYVVQKKTSKAPVHYIDNDGFNLGIWIRSRMDEYKKNILSSERIKELEALPGWVWSVRQNDYKLGFQQIKKYIVIEGTTNNIRQKYVDDDGFNLGNWVSARVSEYRDNKISSERIKELEALPGWVWNKYESDYRYGLGQLKKYITRYGEAMVKNLYIDHDGFNLGTWVQHNMSRYKRNTLSSERIKELEALPGWVWSKRDAGFQNGLKELKKYIKIEGTSRIPDRYTTDNGFKLGDWVQHNITRYNKNELSSARIKELESLPGWYWDRSEASYQFGLKQLKKYVVQKKTSLVAVKFIDEDNFNLGSWTSVKKKDYKKNRLSSERIKDLEALPGWVWSK